MDHNVKRRQSQGSSELFHFNNITLCTISEVLLPVGSCITLNLVVKLTWKARPLLHKREAGYEGPFPGSAGECHGT